MGVFPLKKVLITGIGGFAGSHLAEYLLTIPGLKVYGILRDESETENITHILDKIELFYGDLNDCDFVTGMMGDLCPDYLFHLAAQAATSISWASPAATLTNNIVSQVNLLEALIFLKIKPRILIIGSGDEYGLVRPEEIPVKENNPLRPSNPYAVSKVAQDMLGFQYFCSHQLPIIRVRPFNHTGPRQNDMFVMSSFAKQIASAEAGIIEPILRVGNLDSKRDFTDVRDMVKAYWLAIDEGICGEVYNLGSGRSIRISDALDILLKSSSIPIKVEIDPVRLRPVDVPDVVCDSTLFKNLTGWKLSIPFEKTLNDLLDYWRNKLLNGRSK